MVTILVVLGGVCMQIIKKYKIKKLWQAAIVKHQEWDVEFLFIMKISYLVEAAIHIAAH